MSLECGAEVGESHDVLIGLHARHNLETIDGDMKIMSD